MDNNITIGSDPEFVIMCGDSVNNALEIFSKVFEEDLSCIEPEEPELFAIRGVYYENAAHYINEALNNIQLKAIYKQHPRFAAEILIDILKKQHTIKKIIDIFNISKEELDESISEILLVPERSELYIHKSYGEIPFQELPFHIKSRILWITIKNRMLYKNMDIYPYIPDEKREEFKDKYIDEVLTYYSQYSEAGFPNLEELNQLVSEYIKDDIIENWEYVYETPDDYSKYFCSAEIGCDGHSVTGEMRPRFGNDPIEHFNEILKLMKELEERLKPDIVCYDKELQVKAGAIIDDEVEGEFIFLGGHIHLGFDRIVAETDAIILSTFVGIPLTLIEDSYERVRHRVYGKFGEYNVKAIVNGDTYDGLEFRMPSSWLVSPQITIGALVLAYTTMYEILLGVKGTLKHIDFMKFFWGNKEQYEQEKWDILKEKIPEIYSEVKKMRLYPEYKEYIDYIFDMIEKGEYWNSDADILTTWSRLF